jgi:RNA polymerase sigma-70 factor (ECF subfamily)
MRVCWESGLEQLDSAELGDAVRPRRNGATGGPAARDAGEVPLGALIVAVAGGDGRAFQRLYDLRSSRLYGIALRITRQPSLAADAVHDAYLELWRNAGRFDERRGDADVWLASLVRYRAVDMTRRLGREVSDEDVPEAVDEEPDALARMVASSESAALRGCLGTLEPDRRRVLALAFTDGLSHSELAARLRLPIGTIKSWIRRSLQSLRVCLEAET